MKKVIFIMVVLLLGIFFLSGCSNSRTVGKTGSQDSSQSLYNNIEIIEVNRSQIDCYVDALFFLQEYNITLSLEYINNSALVGLYPVDRGLRVQRLKCAYGDHAAQREIVGMYKANYDDEPVPLYFQEIAGGWAASGADGSEEICLIINNQIVINQSNARCVWQEEFP